MIVLKDCILFAIQYAVIVNVVEKFKIGVKIGDCALDVKRGVAISEVLFYVAGKLCAVGRKCCGPNGGRGGDR